MTVSTAAGPVPNEIDAGWISDLVVRWKLAEEYVADLAMPGAPTAADAVKRLVSQDLPLLLREVIRLRPELA
ncbi:MAG: hypothetical protein JO211_07595 [Acidobacteriaceae bacterium]|nr:hypothetical protein [Acidobacteriaceae bacterium]